MALSRYILNNFFDDFSYPSRTGTLFDQNFGLGVLHDDLIRPRVSPYVSGYICPWPHQTARSSEISNIQNNQDAFKVNLDVQQFKPNEITVKMVDNSVIVEGKHEERCDEHGFISRHFQRRYKLPDDVNPDAVVSKLSSDGVLSIEAPKKAIEPTEKERVIQITRTNAPAVTSKPSSEKVSYSQNATEQMDQ